MEEYRFVSGSKKTIQDELNHLKDFYFIKVVSMVKEEVAITLLLKLKKIAE